MGINESLYVFTSTSFDWSEASSYNDEGNLPEQDNISRISAIHNLLVLHQ